MSKTSGAILEYADERIAHLMNEYLRYISSSPHIRMEELFSHVVNQPAPRFWVSPVRAAVVIASMFRGNTLHNMRPSKIEMFREIYRRVVALREKRPCAPLSVIVEEIVMSPAPKCYLSPSSAKIMIYKAKRKWYARKLKKILRKSISAPCEGKQPLKATE